MRNQHLLLLTILAAAILTPSVQLVHLHGTEPSSKTEKSSLADRIAAIAAEHEKQEKIFHDELRAHAKESKTLGREEYGKRVSAANNKFNEYRRPAAAALAELLKANPSDPAFVDGVIVYESEMSHSIGIVPEFRQILLGEQFANPALGKLCYKFRYNNNDRDAEAILVAAAARHTSADVRGIATYALGEYYRQTARIDWGREMTEEARTQLLHKAAQQFTEVLDKYAAVKAPQSEANLGTLATSSLARVKNIPNLRPGKPAPEFAGTDLNGKPAKLTDFRGKVVVLVYWGSWCGPCMAQVPHERELVERMKDKPFVLLGVNCGDTLLKAQQTSEEKRMNWISLWDGGSNDGPLQSAYNVLHWPTVYVIDAQGTIQHVDIQADKLDAAVDKLVAEIETAK